MDKDLEFLKAIRGLHCLACGATPPSDAHHVKHRGSGGADDAWNVIPLCRRCHQTWHARGPRNFVEKHPHLEAHLKALGWTFGLILGKWTAQPPKAATMGNDEPESHT